ncbi:plasmid partitioning protein RepB C-terminal domain-containing protein [Ralstonia solanacearum]|uniref:plasmid partitioning protein RepB C-terminal domain-containing protein n=1 Tax=Ralstonia solanacearum TaxID=305 RepID=UPI0007C8ABA4|nr:plasmid partitioning protein RepB C-terminal domain-containing protein [Ralstonia solanacearum]OAI79026.1 plasmid stablization protein ParB [Ralstonia solanacearum]
MSDLLGFIPAPLTIPMERILPSHKVPEGIQNSAKFRQILASIETVGLIEPLSVGKADKRTGQHILLDGHIRLLALKELEFTDAPCLVATDDEGYTYNNRVNRLSTIQSHVMIRRALERGVPPEKLAKALNVDVRHINSQARLLNGVCPEAAELLSDHHFSPNLGTVLRKLKSTRQVECVELMIAANNVTVAYAQALLAATPSNLLVRESKPRKLGGVTVEQMAKMEREMGNLQGQIKLAEQFYGQDVLNLVLAKGYLSKLLNNDAVFRFLSQRYPDVLREFETLAQTGSLET